MKRKQKLKLLHKQKVKQKKQMKSAGWVNRPAA
jgi:translation elongation factor EF-4